jgi:hypothetical protein
MSMIAKWMIAAAGLPVLMACGSQPKIKDGGAMDTAWINMFEGNTLSNWHVYNKPGTAGSAWSLKDGVLHLDDTNKKNGKIVDGGNLVYNQEFENFHLKLEWKISEGGNSGIMFYVKEDPALTEPYYTGPEMQVLDNERHPDAKIIKHRAGDLYDLISCAKETVKPAGEWNLAEIVCNKGQLDFFLNGEKVVSTKYGDDAWKAMLSNSKFKEWKSFGIYHSGKIVLQDHDNAVWYRNAMIRRL